jgi:hypothetical protein
MPKMTDTELTNLVDQMLSESFRLSGTEDGGKRERAIEYLNGEMKDIEAGGSGKSKVVSRDVSDAIGWILPGLSRVFLGTEKLVEYEPGGRGGVDPAGEQDLGAASGPDGEPVVRPRKATQQRKQRRAGAVAD